MAIKMFRARDGADALIEDWDLDSYRGYGFVPVSEVEPVEVDEVAEKPKGRKGKKPADAESDAV